MDSIKDIKRRAGISEAGETFTLGKQDEIDTLVKDEVIFLQKVARLIGAVGSYDLKRRLVPVLRDRANKLEKYKKETSKNEG